MVKMCSYCRKPKPLTEFRFLNKQNRYIAYCKMCEKEYDKGYQRERRANMAVLKQEQNKK